MEDLIKALTIFSKYFVGVSPTHCEHDELFVMVDPEKVSEDDKHELELLGFEPSDEFDAFISFRFGSA